jgi:hypothetical protein
MPAPDVLFEVGDAVAAATDRVGNPMAAVIGQRIRRRSAPPEKARTIACSTSGPYEPAQYHAIVRPDSCAASI